MRKKIREKKEKWGFDEEMGTKEIDSGKMWNNYLIYKEKF